MTRKAPRSKTRAVLASATLPSPSSTVWIFQAVPDRYDIVTEVPKRIRDGDWWKVARFRNEIKKGHFLLFWRSGQNAGIYATGETTGVPYLDSGEWHVRVKFYGLLKSPILKDALKQHSRLSALSIIRMAQGTNFRVSPEQWTDLRKLIHENDPENLISGKIDSGTFDPTNNVDGRNRILASIVCRQGQPEFRQELMRIYGRKCAISGCDAEEALEAAHICPYRGAHTNHPKNGLLLRSDLHTLFDLHLVSIDSSCNQVLIAPPLLKTCYGKFSGSDVRLPKDGPSAETLNEHRNEFERLWRTVNTERSNDKTDQHVARVPRL